MSNKKIITAICITAVIAVLFGAFSLLSAAKNEPGWDFKTVGCVSFEANSALKGSGTEETAEKCVLNVKDGKAVLSFLTSDGSFRYSGIICDNTLRPDGKHFAFIADDPAQNGCALRGCFVTTDAGQGDFAFDVYSENKGAILLSVQYFRKDGSSLVLNCILDADNEAILDVLKASCDADYDGSLFNESRARTSETLGNGEVNG